MFYIAPLPFLETAFDLTTLSVITALLILSVLSLFFVFHLRFKSKSLPHLKNFNSIWTVRFLLILFIFLWAITELFRLPFFRNKNRYPFLPSWTTSQQSNVCKVHVVLSLGIFEPAFLIAVLFLVKASIKKRGPNDTREISFVLMTCLPILVFQIISVSFPPLDHKLPKIFTNTSFVWKHGFGNETVLCTYPLLNTIIFGVFGIGYEIWFLFCFWRVLSIVINKGLRLRLYGLSLTVLISLPLGIFFLGLSTLWSPENSAHAGVSLVVFLSTFSRAVVGEGILVIKPITDALDAGGDNHLRGVDSQSFSWSRTQEQPPAGDGDV